MSATKESQKRSAGARRKVWADPGESEATRRMREASALLREGEQALLFLEGEEYGEPVEIIGGYSLRTVSQGDAPYRDANGDRIAYRYGYVVRCHSDGRTGFAPAWMLTRQDCRPAHLCLLQGSAA